MYYLSRAALAYLPPQGFHPESETPRWHPSSSRLYIEKYLQLKYTVSIPEKNLDLLDQGPHGIFG